MDKSQILFYKFIFFSVLSVALFINSIYGILKGKLWVPNIYGPSSVTDRDEKPFLFWFFAILGMCPLLMTLGIFISVIKNRLYLTGMELQGIGLFVLILFFIAGLLLWPVAIVRTALNRDFSASQKVKWILAELFIFPISYGYMIIVEKKLVWRILGCLFLLEVFACPLIYINSLKNSKKLK